MASYSTTDVRRGYHWLGHADAWTEVSVLHPLFRHGDASWNRRHDAWPVTQYLTSEPELLAVVRRYAGERMICYGLNPRPAALMREHGRLRSAREADIAISQNLLLDIDLEGMVTSSRLSSLTRFLSVADEYFNGLGVARPFRAATGRGAHLLFAYPAIPVAEHPDVRDRLRSFKDGFVATVRQDFSRLEAKVDSTQDLRRMVRAYGTSKPTIGVISKFYGKQRREDPALRELLLRLDVIPKRMPDIRPVTLSERLPDWFTTLLAHDETLRDLWAGKGKPAGTDQSTSGYDYTIARHLATHGHKNPDELGTIIALRPTGNARRYTKGLNYVARTVAQALARQGVAFGNRLL